MIYLVDWEQPMGVWLGLLSPVRRRGGARRVSSVQRADL
jgi:hypothetical protein